MKGSRWLGRSIAEKFLTDPLLKYYFIMQCINAVLGLVLVFVDAPVDETTGQATINGFSLMMAMFLPPVEIYLLTRMRKEHQPQKVRNWGMYYLVFFAIMSMVSLLALMGLGVMTFAPEEGAALPTFSDYLAGVWMIISCLYYLFMGVSARQLATLMENKEVRHGMMLPLVIVIGLVSADEAVQLMRGLLTVGAFSLGTMLGVLNTLLAVTGRALISVLFYNVYRSWKEIAANRL